MTGRQVFEGAVEPLAWGRATYTILRLPDDVAAALCPADRTAEWNAFTPGKRRGLTCTIGTAKTAATRDKRIVALIEGLAP